ncbi:MAG: hypothetical protein V4596_06045 [Bdellovibrionota bacterium]
MRGAFLIFLGIIFIIIGNGFQVERKAGFKIYPIKIVQSFHFGHKNTMADTFWLNTIQNMDYCENENMERSYNPGIGVDEALSAKLKPSRCHKGWVFQMMDFITDISPRFEAVYEVGATVLSVVVDDREGAKIIYDKGLEQFPNNWILNYRASYHYLMELQKPGRAADLLMAAYKNGGPDFLPTLASRLWSRVGRATLGYTTLKSFIENNPDSPHISRAKTRLEELKKELNIKE